MTFSLGILTSPDQFTGFRGLAGSGKSTMLKELASVLRSENRQYLFCAPTAPAADTLRREGLEAVAEKIAPAESVAPAEKISPATETEKLRRESRVCPAIKPTEPPRQSRGFRV